MNTLYELLPKRDILIDISIWYIYKNYELNRFNKKIDKSIFKWLSKKDIIKTTIEHTFANFNLLQYLYSVHWRDKNDSYKLKEYIISKYNLDNNK